MNERKDEGEAAPPTSNPRRPRRASHPGTSEAARAASSQADEPARRRASGTDEPQARDARERWILEQRPPHWD